ncbi:hypothetical protein [Streptomyces sp. N50]|uniref:hypothetical protein n=1 Tax=Streptomyces sp. N50 TaxID=3081765 RepID=UPI0029622EBC|nr:hypothetical protein [Streptomyces sp. N50]WOX11504.1 hypothetical protein R2B38_22895 [Streptomyces sp. N50]
MAVEGVQPARLIRDEDPWSFRRAHVRVWRTASDRVVVVISGRAAEDDLETVLPLLRGEYPDDSVDFFFHRPMDWAAPAYYAELTTNGDGTVTRTHLAGDTLAARLGPDLYATEDPDDPSPGWGGA